MFSLICHLAPFHSLLIEEQVQWPCTSRHLKRVKTRKHPDPEAGTSANASAPKRTFCRGSKSFAEACPHILLHLSSQWRSWTKLLWSHECHGENHADQQSIQGLAWVMQESGLQPDLASYGWAIRSCIAQLELALAVRSAIATFFHHLTQGYKHWRPVVIALYILVTNACAVDVLVAASRGGHTCSLVQGPGTSSGLIIHQQHRPFPIFPFPLAASLAS